MRKMRNIVNNIQSYSRQTATQYFPNPLVEGKYKVIPPQRVPQNIVKPSYVNNPMPKFGLYQGQPLVHTPQGILKMKKAAQVASKTLEATQQFIKTKGQLKQRLTQQDIDRFVFDFIIAQNAYPTAIGFMYFPKSVCVSVNECFVHGIPSERPLDLGDKINIDVTAYIDGYHGDNNLTVFYGQPRHEIMKQVSDASLQSLYAAISICKPGVKYNLIGKTIQNVVKKYGFHVCQQFSGHGIGPLLHMPPMVFHRYYPKFSDVMKVGHTFTIEPIITVHPLNNIKIWKDNFTAISDNNPNAQFEHTILIVENGCQVITKRKSEKIPNPNGNITNA